MSTVVDMTDVGKVMHGGNEIVRVLAGDTLVYNANADYTYTTFTVGMYNGESGYLYIGDGVGTSAVAITEIYVNDVAQMLPCKENDYTTECLVEDGYKVKIKGDFILQGSTINEIRSFITGINQNRLKTAKLMFNNCKQLVSVDLSGFNTSSVTDMGYMFMGCSSLTALNLSNFSTSNVTNMCGMFDGCSSLTTLNLSNFNTSNVTDMHDMFDDCCSLTTLDLSSFNTSNVQSMSNMFERCANLKTLDISTFVTSNVTDITSMFYGCSSLTALNLSHFSLNKSRNIFSARYLFNNCSSLTTVNLSNWGNYISAAECDLSYMFYGCANLTNIIGLSDLSITRLATDGFYETFSGCSSLTEVDLSDWRIQYLYEVPGLFGGCTNLVNVKWPETIIGGLIPTFVAQMFYNCAKLTNIPEFVVDWYTNQDIYIDNDYKADCFTGCTSLVKLGNDTYSTNAEAMATIPYTWGGTKY